MNVMTEPNKILASLRVNLIGEFYDEDASEETLRYAVEQDLEDSGFEVDDVSVIRPVKPLERYHNDWRCPCGRELRWKFDLFCSKCGNPIDWNKK